MTTFPVKLRVNCRSVAETIDYDPRSMGIQNLLKRLLAPKGVSVPASLAPG